MKTTQTLKNLSLIILLFVCHFQAKAQIHSEYYGISRTPGGPASHQEIFKTDSSGQNTEAVVEFKHEYGENGRGGLVDNGSGRMFGLAIDGGRGNFARGVLYEYVVFPSVFNKLVEFDTISGSYPRGKLALNNTELFGVTREGGVNDAGVIFVYDYVSGVYTELYDFSTATGAYPESGVILNNQGNLMGMTTNGGANGYGVIYEYNLTTNTYQVIYNFNGADGAHPFGSLLLASNGKYYGLTAYGGAFGHGVAFSLANGVYTKHFDFNYGIPQGVTPIGAFVEHPNGNLYATTGIPYQGNNNSGLIQFDTTTNICSAIYDIQNIDYVGTMHTDLMVHSNGLLYGCAIPGYYLANGNSSVNGSSGSLVFSYDPILDTLHTLSYIQSELASTLIEGANSDIYGVTLGEPGFTYGNNNPLSKLFNYDVSNGTLSDLFTWPYEFGTRVCSFMEEGPNGIMYGFTEDGGTNQRGVIFEYNSIANTRTVLLNFPSNFDSDAFQLSTPGTFVKASNKLFLPENDKLYSYMLGGATLTVEHDFISATGWYDPRLTAGSDGNIYGQTRYAVINGVNYDGTIFRYNVLASTYEVLHYIDVVGSVAYRSPLLEVDPGIFYFTQFTYQGNDAIYEYNANTDVLTQKHLMTSMTNPRNELLKASNGKLYGIASSGGNFGTGGIFEYDYQNDVYTEVFHAPSNISFYETPLTEGADQKLYVFVSTGGEIIEYDPQTNTTTINPTPYTSVVNERTRLIRTDICSNSYGSIAVQNCAPYISPGGNSYSVSGSYPDTISGVNFCGGDSIVTINLTILPSSTNTDVQSACDSYTWIDGNTYTASNNTAQYVVPNAIGCDSIITLDLTINSFTTSIDQQTACSDYTWIDGNTYTASNNTATYILPNQQGCDSIITLDLTITNDLQVTVSYTSIGALVATSPTAQTFQWLNCDSNYAEIPGETSLLYLPATNGNYAVVVTEGTCTDTSDCFTVADAGLEEDLNNNIRLYPNPTNDIITIQTSFVIDAIEVYSLAGELMLRSENENQIDLSSFANGTYLFKIQSGDSISLQKVVKN